MDFGSESLKVYKDAPQVGDVVFLNELEKIQRLFDLIFEHCSGLFTPKNF